MLKKKYLPGAMHVTQSTSTSCLIPSLNVDKRALGLCPALAEKFMSHIAKTIKVPVTASYPQYGFFPSGKFNVHLFLRKLLYCNFLTTCLKNVKERA